jgi:hypothetical protein
MARRAKIDIHRDDSLIFFPTIGHFDSASQHWHLPLHGWIFKPETNSLRRAAAVSVLRSWLGLDRTSIEGELFAERLWAFLVDNQPRKAVTIRIGRDSYELTPSTPNGHILDALRLPAMAVEAALAEQTEGNDSPNSERWLNLDVIMPPGDERRVRAALHLLDEQGLSVISDIDDTIKVTHVHDRAALLRQTFFRDFESVPGMADLYGRWQAAGAAFHYVSRSPWQLYTPLAEFVVDHGFPAGTFHMRNFRWKNASTLESDKDGSKKLAVIEEIFMNLPQRRFVCVGDSGEHDPEVYAQLARRHPQQVQRIFIRCVAGEERRSARLLQTFRGLPDDLWQAFLDPLELPSAIV